MNITKMAKKKNMNNRRILNFVSVLSLFLMFSFAFMPSVIAQDDFVITPVGSEDNNCQIGEVYLQDRGCIKPQFNADFNVFPTPEGKISSSLGEIQAIRINNPYAAGGQPVVVEFTLQNIGDQLGVGHCILEVTQPRVPCFKLGIAVGNMNMPRLFIENFATGAYLRVLQEGFIEAGNAVEVIKEGQFKLSIQSVFRAYFDKEYRQPVSVMQKALLLPELSTEWRKKLSVRLVKINI